MTIDEAIAHAREVAKESRENIITGKNLEQYESDCNVKCEQCAEEYEQLIEWLEELKAFRENKWTDVYIKRGYIDGYSKAENDYHAQSEKDRQSSYDCGYEVGYDKAIDDFLEKIQWEYINGCGITQRQIYFLKAVSNQVAEQLKEGEENGK